MLLLQVSEALGRDVTELLRRDVHTSGKTFAASGGDVTLDLEHATGLERSGASTFS